MKSNYFILIIICAFYSCAEKTTPVPYSCDILEQLQDLENVVVSEIPPQNGFGRQFELFITQPLDHEHPEIGTLQQRIYISHTGIDKPVIFMPSGYSSSPVKVCELSELLDANQIYVAHRFMAGAKPVFPDWQYLNIKQASADFHRVVVTLKQVYDSPWVSYGKSKNGQAALFHRRFYPDDVKVTVALVAPLSHGTEDPRYDAFLEQVGSEDCRDKIKSFQIMTLKKRDSIEVLINDYIATSEFYFSRMGAPEILEFEVLEFPFSFWQVSDGNCLCIPDSSDSAVDIFQYIKNFGYLDFYSDELLEHYEPVYYQAYTELGWYRLIDDHLSDLIKTHPSYRKMAPQNVPLNYDSSVLYDVENWLRENGDNIIYIYGQNDPWTAGAIESVGSTNTIKIIQPGANHSIDISMLNERDFVIGQIKEWLGY